MAQCHPSIHPSYASYLLIHISYLSSFTHHVQDALHALCLSKVLREYVLQLSSALLSVPLLSTLIIDKRNTKAGLVALCPLEVATIALADRA